MDFRVLTQACFLAVSILSAAAQQPAANPRATAELDQGIALYQKGHYRDATRHLRKSLQQDPESVQARLYLAKALSEQFDEWEQTTKSSAFAGEARTQFEEVLKRQPASLDAIRGLASLAERRQQTQDARSYYQKAVAIAPKESAGYTGLGKLGYFAVQDKLAETPGFYQAVSQIDHPLCISLRGGNLPTLDESIGLLKKAYALNDADATAATFLGVAYNTRANLECGDTRARDEDRKQGASWMEKAMKAQQKDPGQPVAMRAVPM